MTLLVNLSEIAALLEERGLYFRYDFKRRTWRLEAGNGKIVKTEQAAPSRDAAISACWDWLQDLTRITESCTI